MDIKDMPLNQSTVIVDNKNIRVIALRTNINAAIVTWEDPSSNREVLRTTVDVFTGASTIESFDSSFWKVSVNGVQKQNFQIAQLHGKKFSIQADPLSRSLEFNSIQRKDSEMADFSQIDQVVVTVGRSTPTGVQLLGTCFLLTKKGLFATASHVTGEDDTNLIIAFKQLTDRSQYQDTSDPSVNYYPAKIHAYDPIHDLCVLKTDVDAMSSVPYGNTDNLTIGENVFIFGYPHANQGRMVLTQQRTEIGAKILIKSGDIKSKHVVLNIQSRPGQSGSPIFHIHSGALSAILIGSYAPGGGGGISLGGIDPQTLHQTTHAVSAEYLERMI